MTPGMAWRSIGTREHAAARRDRSSRTVAICILPDATGPQALPAKRPHTHASCACRLGQSCDRAGKSCFVVQSVRQPSGEYLKPHRPARKVSHAMAPTAEYDFRVCSVGLWWRWTPFTSGRKVKTGRISSAVPPSSVSTPATQMKCELQPVNTFSD